MGLLEQTNGMHCLCYTAWRFAFVGLASAAAVVAIAICMTYRSCMLQNQIRLLQLFKALLRMVQIWRSMILFLCA